MAGTYTVTMEVSGGAAISHVFAGLTGRQTQHLLDHFNDSVMKKIIGMMGEPDDRSMDGASSPTFRCVTTRDEDGKAVGQQDNVWMNLSDAAVGALEGAFAAGLAKLDRQIAAKHHAHPGHGK